MNARLIVAVALLLSAQVSAASQSAEPLSQAPPAAVVAQLRTDAVTIDTLEAPPREAEARALAGIVAGARVIALGEIGHGYREPLRYRNRLIRHLVARHQLTAVALESGLAESRQLHDYVLGGPGDPAVLVGRGLTHGFGQIAENVDLIEWLRGHNLRHPDRPVRFYGIDVSTIQSALPGEKGYGIVLDRLIGYLAATVPAASVEPRAGLARYARRFTEADYPDWTAADRVEASALLARVRTLFRTQRRAMIAGSSAERYDWARREAHDAAQLLPVFAAWTNDPTQLDRLRDLIELRDRAMADHVGWVLEREGPRGSVLLFQTNGHVTAAPVVGSVMRSFARQPRLTGMWLRERLANRYRVIGSVSSRGRRADDATLGSVDRVFAAAGRAPVLFTLRDRRLPAWWRAPQTAAQGDARIDDLTPARAFDALVYHARLTPLPPPRP